MAYTKTEWKTGDIVTSQKLNKLENGVANANDGGSLKNIQDYSGTYTYTHYDSSTYQPVEVTEKFDDGIIENDIENNIASKMAHAEGLNTQATGNSSHAEGMYTTASGESSHTEGNNTTASGESSHAEGNNTTASDYCSHAEGMYTTASSFHAHAEGSYTKANGGASHAEGCHTAANGFYSHAEGYKTIANGAYQHVFGFGNTEDIVSNPQDKGTYIEIVGNSTSSIYSDSIDRSNARTLDWSGNERLAGSLTLGMGTADEITITAAQLKQLIAMINNS